MYNTDTPTRAELPTSAQLLRSTDHRDRRRPSPSSSTIVLPVRIRHRPDRASAARSA